MRIIYLCCFTLVCSCKYTDDGQTRANLNLSLPHSVDTAFPTAASKGPVSYEKIKLLFAEKRKAIFQQQANPSESKTKQMLQDLWVNSLLNEFYPAWAGTPSDFNGTTQIPGEGAIACGYFVTTLLEDMGVKLQRVKLAVVPSSEMMRALVPKQPLRNLSTLTETAFYNQLQSWDKGIYVIGLDFHTGLIVNDGNEVWFIHSNYIDRKGVIKELVNESRALHSSKTKWLISLTGDNEFLERWIMEK